MVLYSPERTNIGFSFILLTVNLLRHPTLIEHGLYLIQELSVKGMVVLFLQKTKVLLCIHLNAWKYNVCSIKLESKVMRLYRTRV